VRVEEDKKNFRADSVASEKSWKSPSGLLEGAPCGYRQAGSLSWDERRLLPFLGRQVVSDRKPDR